ncbi:MAG: hypothetical protein B7Y99_11780 [Caulobacterales bacterium 32-69-10]|nr:MAG: hypothetical protein B7Y99_11780 [Caulobacterales bacterium 32-69-10]
MNLLEDRRILLAGGAGAALLAGVLIAVFIMGKDRPAEPGAAKGALQIELGEQQRVNPNQQLRCFVGGQFIGSATLADCAKRNGVAAQSLDVGLDESGELAAGGESLKPLPQIAPPTQVAVASPPPVPVMQNAPVLTATAGPPIAECLRYGPDGWRPAGSVTQSACVQTLFEGRCQSAGQALYGRWGSQTLRLVPGRVEASPDNRSFHMVVEQRSDCSIPAS